MIADAINAIVGLAQQANAIQIESCDTLRRVIIRKGDDYEMHEFPAVPRGGALMGIEDLIAAALDEEFADDPEVYHTYSEILILVDRDDRHERVHMPLQKTQRFQHLVRMALPNSIGVTPRELIRTLRFDLPVPGVEPLIQVLRKVEFTRRSDGAMNTEHGRESLGRSVEAAVQTPGDRIPELIELTLPVYSNPGLREASTVTIRCGIHIDPDNGTVRLAPLADELTMAENTAQVAIGTLLRSRLAEIPVFFGAPE